MVFEHPPTFSLVGFVLTKMKGCLNEENNDTFIFVDYVRMQCFKQCMEIYSRTQNISGTKS